jgi:1-acyl-sn-glycerol-3-phosphate acyltransferase
MKEPLFYRFIRPILYVWFTLKYKPTIINYKVIPKKGRVILAGNHTNNLDCMILGYGTHRCVRFVAKDELAKGPTGIFFKMMGIIPVNRKIHDKSVIPTCNRLLNKEAIIGIFPEGTINRTKDIIMPFKKGAIAMSFDTDSPIIPFAITGKYKKDEIKIRFGDLYYPKTRDCEKEVEVLEDKVIALLKKG